jgi:hypothetical protein
MTKGKAPSPFRFKHLIYFVIIFTVYKAFEYVVEVKDPFAPFFVGVVGVLLILLIEKSRKKGLNAGFDEWLEDLDNNFGNGSSTSSKRIKLYIKVAAIVMLVILALAFI